MAYRYGSSSVVRDRGDGREVLLATSGGMTEVGPARRPRFFSGFLTDPAPAALGMLACAAVARSRYCLSGSVLAMLRDPVVTSSQGLLRFESFSSCCGVHARLDLLPGALGDPPLVAGTTNVDFNDPMRAALGGAAVSGPLLLSVGSGELVVDTLGGSVTRALAPALGQRPLWASPAAGTFALGTTARRGAACVAGPHRLAELGPLFRFARGLRAYGPDVDAGAAEAPSAWELDLGSARFTLTLSAEKYRGFSGEGALLELLADEDVAADALLVGAVLDWNSRIDARLLGTELAIGSERVSSALAYLAASGRVGYDLADESYFRRELPFGPALETMHPRLASARALVESGAVTLSVGGAVVRSGDSAHRVTIGDGTSRCTCPWWGKHQGSRGPCKHVLAARLAGR